jgi:hypothetical protein
MSDLLQNLLLINKLRLITSGTKQILTSTAPGKKPKRSRSEPKYDQLFVMIDPTGRKAPSLLPLQARFMENCNPGETAFSTVSR